MRENDKTMNSMKTNGTVPHITDTDQARLTHNQSTVLLAHKTNSTACWLDNHTEYRLLFICLYYYYNNSYKRRWNHALIFSSAC